MQVAAREAGCVGVSIEGPVTDVRAQRRYGLPIRARGLSTVTGKRSPQHGKFCVEGHAEKS